MYDSMPQIDLCRQRDFGAVVSGAFELLRQEFKPLMRALLLIAGPFVLLSIIVSIAAQLSIGEMAFEPDVNADPNDLLMEFAYWTTAVVTMPVVLLSAFFSTLAYWVVLWIGYLYAHLYVEKGSGISVEDITGAMFANVGMLVFVPIFISIVLTIAFMCCTIPGLYLLPIMLLLPILKLDRHDLDFSGALSAVFNIIKDNWWFSFGLIIIMGILAYVLNLIFQLPLFLVALMDGINGSDLSSDPVYLSVLTTISSLGTFCFVVIALAFAVHYYNLRERRDATGLMNRIDDINDDEGDDAASSDAFFRAEPNPDQADAGGQDEQDDTNRFRPPSEPGRGTDDSDPDSQKS